MDSLKHISKSNKSDTVSFSRHCFFKPNNIYEQGSDLMTDHIMGMPMNHQPFFSSKPLNISKVQRKCKDCEDEEKLHRKENLSQSVEESSEVSSYIESLSSKGSPLHDSTRSFFEPRFGHDFADVKIHHDADAAKSSQSVNALAYTVGNNIVFNQNQFSPESEGGKKLLAHELTHVVQQNNGFIANQNQISRQSNAPANSGLPFDNEPVPLQDVLKTSYIFNKFGCKNGIDAADCYNRLGQNVRSVLHSLYNRLNRFGLWGHIFYMSGIWTEGVGGAHFEVRDHLKFLNAVIASGRFCIDSALGGLLHKGATSIREISKSDSLHLSMENGNLISAHIDAISPASGRYDNFHCQYDSVAATAHLGREAIPDAIKLPQLQIFPERRPNFGVPDRQDPPPEFIRLEIKF